MLNELIKFIMLGLKPPTLPVGREPTDDELCKYRKQNDRQKHAVAGTLWTILILGTVYFFWARGDLVDWIGPGFAYAVDVEKRASDIDTKLNKLATSLDSLVLQQLRNNLRETRRLQCLAKESKDEELVARYAADLEAQMATYYDMLKREWIIPRCGDT